MTNFIDDFPGTKFKEDALFYKTDSAYKLAINSVTQKMQERLLVAKADCASLIKFKADTKYKNKVEAMLTRIDKDLNPFWVLFRKLF